MGFKTKLADDKVFTKNMKKLLRIQSKDEAWANELESLHARRGIRALKSNSLLESSQKIAIDSNIDNQAVRSRCVEIKISALRQQIVMDETISLLRKYLGSKYSKYLTTKYKNVTEKRNAIEYVLEPIVRVEDRIKLVIKLADVVIDDCDSAGYTMHRIGEVLNSKSKERKGW